MVELEGANTCSCTSFVLTFHVKEEDNLVFFHAGLVPLDARNFMHYEFVHLLFHRVLLLSVWLFLRMDFVPFQMGLIVT